MPIRNKSITPCRRKMLQDGEAVDDKVSLLTINVLCRISKYAAYPTVINPAIIPKTLKITPYVPKIGGDSPKNIQAVNSMKIGAVSDMEYTEENSPTSYALNPTGIIIVLNAPVINTARQKSGPNSGKPTKK